MSVPQFINGNASTTAAADATAAAVTVTPAATAGFPNTPDFTVLVRETGELMRVTAINVGPTWTVVRGFGGSTAAAIVGTGGAPYHFDYSITREMLLLGFVMKLDEVFAAADTANGVLTLNVPSWASGLGLRGLRVMCSLVSGTATGTDVGNLLMRLNGDVATTTYFTEWAYWGTSSSSVAASGLAFARLPWQSQENLATPTNFGEHIFDIANALDTDRWKSWSGTFHAMGGAAARYSGPHGGEWRNVAAISTLAFSCDVSQNSVWAANTIKAGSRVILYGLP